MNKKSNQEVEKVFKSFYHFVIRGVEYNEPHEGQKLVLESSARFKVVDCGRRWGKTAFCIITVLEQAYANSGHTYWYVAPTFRQAKTIAWRFLMSRIRMLPKSEQLKCRINETALSIELPNGSLIELKGVERPENILGSGLDGVVLDEYSVDTYGTFPVWKEIIRPSLSDKQGWAIFISTPKGYNHFYDVFAYAEDTNNANWEAFKMPSSTNPALTEEELDSARHELGPDLFSQEYEAEFRKRSGLVYNEFDRETHGIDEMDLETVDSRWSLEVGIDFGGAHPTAAVFILFSPIDDTAYIVDEYYQSNTSSDKHLNEMISIENKWLSLLKKPRPTARWGDSAAKQLILDYNKRGYHITPTIKGRGSVGSGIDTVKRWLGTNLVSGKPKLFIDKIACPNTLREFENYAYTDDGRVEDDEVMRLARKKADKPKKVWDDAMDAVRYVMAHHVPISRGYEGSRLVSLQERDPLTGI